MTYEHTPHLPASTPADRAALRRDVLDALSATGAALGAVEFIKTTALTPSEVTRLAIVERHLSAALVALDALASGLGIQLNAAQPITGASGASVDRLEDRGADHGEDHGEG